MKKLTALMLVLSLVTVILCSCSSSEPSSQTAPSVQASKALSEVFADIKAQVQLSEMNEFTNAASLDRYYGIAEADIQEFAGGINNSGVEQEEIVLVKAADSGKAEAIKAALENRLNAKLNENVNYNPEQAEMIKKCKVEQNELYVSMIVSENAEKITEIYKSETGIA